MVDYYMLTNSFFFFNLSFYLKTIYMSTINNLFLPFDLPFTLSFIPIMASLVAVFLPLSFVPTAFVSVFLTDKILGPIFLFLLLRPLISQIFAILLGERIKYIYSKEGYIKKDSNISFGNYVVSSILALFLSLFLNVFPSTYFIVFVVWIISIIVMYIRAGIKK